MGTDTTDRGIAVMDRDTAAVDQDSATTDQGSVSIGERIRETFHEIEDKLRGGGPDDDGQAFSSDVDNTGAYMNQGLANAGNGMADAGADASPKTTGSMGGSTATTATSTRSDGMTPSSPA